MKSPRITPLPFQTLKKRWKGIWWRKTIVNILAFVAFIIALFFITFILNIKTSPDNSHLSTTPTAIFEDIFTGIVGGAIVSMVSWFRKVSHNTMHYGKQLQDHINMAQSRYQITYDEAGKLLEFDNIDLLTIDNFFRYIGTSQENLMLPRIQKFGTVLIPRKRVIDVSQCTGKQVKDFSSLKSISLF